MATKIIMPKQGLQMTEGTIIHWLVKEGDKVAVDQPLFEMETDKLVITIYASTAGTLLKIVRGEGETVPITELIAVIGEPGEDYSALLAESPAAATAAPTPPAPATPATPTAGQPVPAKTGGGRIFATPRAWMRAEDAGMNLDAVAGTGPDGLIIERDVLAAAPRATPLARKIAGQEGIPLAGIAGSGPRGKIRKADLTAAPSSRGAGERDIRPLGGMRRIIAERMKQSLDRNAQAVHRLKVRMAEATRCRKSLEAAGDRVSFTALTALAVARALRDHPDMNAEFLPEGIWVKDFVNLGIAVALDTGLVVPVIRDADRMGLAELAEAIRVLADKAKKGTLTPDDCSDGSFTISNLGMLGLDEFTAIINPPESGILAVGGIEPTPVAVGDRVEVQPVMVLTLSYDHRVVDGAPAARFLCAIRDYLENPYRLL